MPSNTNCRREGSAPKGNLGAPEGGIASAGGMVPENGGGASFEELYLKSCCKNPNPNDGCDAYSPHPSDDDSPHPSDDDSPHPSDDDSA